MLIRITSVASKLSESSRFSAFFSCNEFALQKTALIKNEHRRSFTRFSQKEPVRNILISTHKVTSFCNYSVRANEKEDNLRKIISAEEEKKDEGAKREGEKAEEIGQIDPELPQKLKILEFEVSMLRERGYKVPKKLKEKDWIALMETKTQSQKLKFLTFLFINERKRESQEAKKEEKRAIFLKKQSEEKPDVYYGIGGMGLFLRIYERTLSRLYNDRLLGAMLYSQKIVIDCSYDNYMTKINQHNCAIQLCYSFAANRTHAAPFFVSLCNVRRNSHTMKHLEKILPSVFQEDFPWDVHEQSYLDLFPREKIVYLTPHAKKPLIEYNHDDIYVIGAFVDKGTGVKASLAKATESKVRMAKLPLDHYLEWKQGGKSLSINAVLSILLDQRMYNDWNIAFKNIPRRFLHCDEEVPQEE